ncbi:MAG: hypothetical protein ACYCT2_02910 [Thermoplasmataceae archaeon]
MELTVDHLSSGYGRSEILHDLTFRISDPGIHVLREGMGMNASSPPLESGCRGVK